ncbi:MBL fold metallo-hydrolase [Ensifer soli]|uniref:MBL fold metallo-hydrolase n=1 Tax=Ciceribacter sp. sgz301302 TaxID=3342379 RepID=UPI0035BA2D47
MTSTLTIGRRTLFAAAAGAVAAPAILSRAAFAETAESGKDAAMERTLQFPLGDVTVSVVRDGIRVSENPQETFGTNQTPEAVADLLQANFLPADRFANGFTPVLVKAGDDLVLFDTGLGEGARAMGGGRLRAGLAQLGHAPEDVTVVVLTHMHGDHIGGLMEGGKPAFPNARYVTGEAEFDFWRDPARAGTPAEGGHKGVLEKVVPLAEKMTFVGDGGTVVPGITALTAFGHSPGHMIYRIDSAGKSLLLTADTANHYVLSLQRPDWEVRFDMDKQAAAATRKKVFDMIATDRLPFIGYHMPFPSVGFAEKAGEGYRFVPASYQFEI